MVSRLHPEVYDRHHRYNDQPKAATRSLLSVDEDADAATGTDSLDLETCLRRILSNSYTSINNSQQESQVQDSSSLNSINFKLDSDTIDLITALFLENVDDIENGSDSDTISTIYETIFEEIGQYESSFSQNHFKMILKELNRIGCIRIKNIKAISGDDIDDHNSQDDQNEDDKIISKKAPKWNLVPSDSDTKKVQKQEEKPKVFLTKRQIDEQLLQEKIKDIEKMQEESLIKEDLKNTGPGITNTSSNNSKMNSESDANLSEDSKFADDNISQIKNFLRRFNEPITLFGESNYERYLRYKHIESNMSEYEAKAYGSGISTRKALALEKSETNFGKRQKQDHGNESPEEDEEILKSKTNKRRKIDSESQTKSEQSQTNHSMTNSDSSDANYVATWIRYTLRKWEEDLESSEKSANLTEAFTQAMFKETKLFLKPLRQMLKHNDDEVNENKSKSESNSNTSSSSIPKLDSQILSLLTSITQLVSEKSYQEASSTYLKLSIGNQAWPLGVSAIGIHERKARSLISESNQAHVLSDELTRKWIHSFKRLMSYAEKKWPR